MHTWTRHQRTAGQNRMVLTVRVIQQTKEAITLKESSVQAFLRG